MSLKGHGKGARSHRTMLRALYHSSGASFEVSYTDFLNNLTEAVQAGSGSGSGDTAQNQMHNLEDVLGIHSAALLSSLASGIQPAGKKEKKHQQDLQHKKGNKQKKDVEQVPSSSEGD